MSKEKPTPESNPMEHHPYELLNVDHELVKKFKPEFFAKGGEHIVYEIPAQPGIVAKANVWSIHEMLYANKQMLLRPDALTDGVKQYMKNSLRKEAEEYQNVRAFFGAEHVLNQKKFLMKVPMTANILREIGEDPADVPKEVWAVVMIQKRAELEGPDHLSLVNKYAENCNVPREIYQDATAHLLYGIEGLGMSGKDALLRLQGTFGEHLEALISRAEQDGGLKEMLKDLVEKLISYFEETGKIFDVVGKDNIAIMKENGVWTYKFVDAIYSGDPEASANARGAIVKLAKGEEITKQEQNELMNTLNFIRAMNGLAEFTGSEKRINIIPDEVRDVHINFQEALQKTYE